MHKQTRDHFNKFLHRIAELNHVADATQKFNVEPALNKSCWRKFRKPVLS